MSGIVQRIRQEWQQFKREEPGKRFIEHYRRSQHNRTPGRTAVRIIVGILLLAGGIFLWFVPGPGWLFVFFGLAMFAGISQGLARFLDKVELKLRKWLTAAKRFWNHARTGVKAAIAGAALAVVGVVCYGAWMFLFN